MAKDLMHLREVRWRRSGPTGGRGVRKITVRHRSSWSAKSQDCSIYFLLAVLCRSPWFAINHVTVVGQIGGRISSTEDFMAKLTVLKVDAMKTPGRYCDGGGLYLQVRGPETKSWLFRYQMKGHARSMGLGPYPVRTLAMARMDALEARRLIFQGLDPIEAKAATTVARKVEEGSGRTFRDVAAEHIEAQRGGWKNPKSAAQWTASLEAHVFPKLGGMAVSKIATDDVLAVLKPIWSTVPETAGRVRQRIEAIMDAAVAMKLRAPGPNPAAWQSNLQPLLPPLARMKKAAGQASHPALPWAQMPSFMEGAPPGRPDGCQGAGACRSDRHP